MDASANLLYFFAAFAAVFPRPMLQAAVPRYFLYGEPPQAADDRFLHLEDLDDRTRPAAWRIRPHAHADLHQVFRILQGRGAVTVEGETIAFEAPCALLVPAGVVHGFVYETGSTGRVLTLSDALLRQLARDEGTFAALFEGVRTVPLPGHHRLDALLDGLSGEQAGAAAGRHVALMAHLTLLLIELMRLIDGRMSGPATSLAAHAEIVARFRSEIEDNYRRDWPLAKYCARIGVTAGRLRSACRTVADATPGQLIAERIVREAKRFLRYSDLPVSDIAYGLGFQDPAYFSRYFARATGQTPSAFRTDRARPCFDSETPGKTFPA